MDSNTALAVNKAVLSVWGNGNNMIRREADYFFSTETNVFFFFCLGNQPKLWILRKKQSRLDNQIKVDCVLLRINWCWFNNVLWCTHNNKNLGIVS